MFLRLASVLLRKLLPPALAVSAVTPTPAADTPGPAGTGFTVVSEAGRININALMAQGEARRTFLTKLFNLWGLGNDEADALFDRMIDWTDADSETLLHGMERADYKAIYGEDTPYPFNRPFRDLEELTLVPGFDQVAANRPDWRDYLTISRFGKIDFNEAEPEVLAAVAVALNGPSDPQRDYMEKLEEATELVMDLWGPDGIPDTADDIQILDHAELSAELQRLGLDTADPAVLDIFGIGIVNNSDSGDPLRAWEDLVFFQRVALFHANPEEVLQITVLQAPAWLSHKVIRKNIVLTGTPALSDTGAVTIQLTATDQSGIVTIKFLAILISEVDDRPVVELPPPLLVDEDSGMMAIELTAIVWDEETPAAQLAFGFGRRCSPLPGGAPPPIQLPPFVTAVIDPSTAILRVTPLANAFGTGHIDLFVREPSGWQTCFSLPVTVRPVPDAPEVVAAPQPVTANPAGDDVSLALGEFFRDADPGDALRYSITGNTLPGLLSGITVDDAGVLRFGFAPYVSGTTTLTLRATDTTGLTVDTPLNVTLPGLPAPAVAVTQSLTLVRQTGLLEQRIRVTNTAARAIGGFELRLSQLPPGVSLYNGSDCSGESQCAGWNRPVAAGESIVLTLQYYSPTRQTNWTPQIEAVASLPLTESPAAAGLAIDHSAFLPDGSFMLEFPSEPGATYEVSYSNDVIVWSAVAAPVRAGGTRVQWIDRGPPSTPGAPLAAGSRFYRVRRLAPPP